jgi:hypothetical protein
MAFVGNWQEAAALALAERFVPQQTPISLIISPNRASVRLALRLRLREHAR